MARARITEDLNADTAFIDNLPSDLEAVLDEAAPAGPTGKTTASSLHITSGFESASRAAPVKAYFASASTCGRLQAIIP